MCLQSYNLSGKPFLLLFWLCLGMWSISGCSEEINRPEAPSYLFLRDDKGVEMLDIRTGSQAATFICSLSASEAWTVSEVPDWISLSALQGQAGSHSLSVTLSANSQPQDRSARIAVSTGHAQCILSVFQDAALDIQVIPLSCDPSWARHEGGTDSLIIRSSLPWHVPVESDWLSLSSQTGNAGETRIALTSRQNDNTSSRTSDLVFSVADDAHYRCQIRQFPNIFNRHILRKLRVRNSLTLQYQGVRFEKIIAVLPLPYSDPYQNISSTQLFQGAGQHVCEDGHNRYLMSVLSAADTPPSGGVVNGYSFDVEIMSVSTDFSRIDVIQEYDTSAPDYLLYTGTDTDGKGLRLVDPTDPDIISVSSVLWQQSGGDVITFARSCYEWTARNMTYGKAFTGLHPISELMKERVGDCGNFSSVFISLLRARGIPARHLHMISPLEGYHIRAEFYLSGYGWVPVDPTFKNSNPGGDYFGIFSGQYIVVSRGSCVRISLYDHPYTIALLQQYWCRTVWQDEGGSYAFRHDVTLLGGN